MTYFIIAAALFSLGAVIHWVFMNINARMIEFNSQFRRYNDIQADLYVMEKCRYERDMAKLDRPWIGRPVPIKDNSDWMKG